MNNMKAVKVAEKLGVDTPTFSSWKSGKKSPPYESLIELAQLYNVSIDYLLGNDVPASVDALTPISKESIILPCLGGTQRMGVGKYSRTGTPVC